MIGDRKREFCDSGGLGMRIEKDPLQIGDMQNNALYTFGENTIEVDFLSADEVPTDFPFTRVKSILE